MLFATLCQRNVCMGQMGISTDARFSSQQKTTRAFRSVGSSARPACGCAVIRFQSSLSHEALGTCTWLCPADCIQARITHKERSTSHFTLEEVGWFSDMSASRLPEYSSLVVSTVNGKVTGDVTSIFCHSVTCLGTDQCCWDGNHMPG